MSTPETPSKEIYRPAGRAPWYHGTNKPFVIGVTGGSASGKTSVCQAIVSALNLPWVGLLSMDRYYKVLSPSEIEICKKGLYNFDHPDAFDVDSLHADLTQLKNGKAVDVPIYDFVTHSRSPVTDRMYGVDIIIVEGILLFYSPKILELLDLKIYVDTDNDLRLARRIKRDIVERGRSVENVLDQYQRTVKPSFEQFIQPTKRFADLIVPWNETNNTAVDLLTQHISAQLMHREHAAGLPASYRGRLPHHAPPSHHNLLPNTSQTTAEAVAAAAAAAEQRNHKSSHSPYLSANPSTLLINSPTLGAAIPRAEDLDSLVLSGESPYSIQSSPSFNSSHHLPIKPITPDPSHFGQPNKYTSGFSVFPKNPLQDSIAAAENHIAPIISHVQHLHNQTVTHHCESNDKMTTTSMTYPKTIPNNLVLIPPTRSLTAIHTTLRDKNTNTEGFRFALSRVVRIISSEAMNLVKFRERTIFTPTGEEFHGLDCDTDQVVAVSIVRAGEAFEHPVRDVIKDICIGKIVIQHDYDKTSGPRLYYAKLPLVNNPNSKILLFDGVLATGSAVIMAIHVLLDHGALPENIIFCCIAAAPEGLFALTSMFPQVKVVTSSLEHCVDEYLHAVPGVAYVADRWFGTMHAPSTPRSQSRSISPCDSTGNVNTKPSTVLEANEDAGDVVIVPL